MEQNPIESPLQQAIVDFLVKSKVNQRSVGSTIGVSETTFGKWRAMKSAMKLDNLDKVLSNYTGAREALIEYLRGNTDEKPTPDGKNMDIEKLKEQLIKQTGTIEWLDEQKNKIQRELDVLKEEYERLTAENQSLRKRLIDAGITDNPKK